MNSNCSNLLDLVNLKERVKKAFCYQKLFWSFTVWINCSSDLKMFANSRSSAWNFKGYSRSLEHFFLTVGQNNSGNKLLFIRVELGMVKQNFGNISWWKSTRARSWWKGCVFNSSIVPNWTKNTNVWKSEKFDKLIDSF